MPYLHCPRCRLTAAPREESKSQIACRHCGTALDPTKDNEIRFLAGAVRERFARDTHATAGKQRFVRD